MSILPRTSGIYCITCIPNLRIYIGSAANFHHRWMSHWQALKRGDHKNTHLQNAWNKYGERAFLFNVLEECMLDKLIEREQFYIDTLKPFAPHGFNVALGAKSVMLGRKHKPESIIKMSINRAGHVTTDEHRAKLSKAGKGRKQSAEHIEKRVTPLRGRTQSEESRARTSEATKQGMTTQVRAHIADKQAKHYILTTPDGIEVRVFNLEKYSRENGLHASALREVANGKRPHYKKWLCRHA